MNSSSPSISAWYGMARPGGSGLASAVAWISSGSMLVRIDPGLARGPVEPGHLEHGGASADVTARVEAEVRADLEDRRRPP